MARPTTAAPTTAALTEAESERQALSNADLGLRTGSRFLFHLPVAAGTVKRAEDLRETIADGGRLRRAASHAAVAAELNWREAAGDDIRQASSDCSSGSRQAQSSVSYLTELQALRLTAASLPRSV
jgi:hypothetical protein